MPHSQGFLQGFIATDFTVPLTCIREACWPPSSAQERGWLAFLQGAGGGLATGGKINIFARRKRTAKFDLNI